MGTSANRFTVEESGNDLIITDCDPAAANELVIPAAIKGKPVTSIGYMAFHNCRFLRSISTLEGVIGIRSFASIGCFISACIELPDSLINIGGHAFNHCSGLTSQGRSHTSWARIGN
jgi:hypothetical protein